MRSPSPAFSLSDACRAAGTATPSAERRERRALLAWSPVVLVAVAAAWYAGGLPAGMATLAAGGAILWAAGTRTSRRRRALWLAPFPPKHESLLLRRIPHYRSLDEPGRELFRQRVKLFLDGVDFHGVDVRVTDGLRLRAAAAAVIPTLGFDEWEWTRPREIIFRSEGYEHGMYEDENGVVTEYEESGMVGGPGILSGVMMLSSRDLAWEFANPGEGFNVGIHEFAHLMTSGGLTIAREDGENWAKLRRKEAVRIRRDESLLDEYALLNDEEFFAVASELFFTIPRRFKSWHRELYALLSRCYQQDAAAWLDTGEPTPDRPPRRRKRRPRH